MWPFEEYRFKLDQILKILGNFNTDYRRVEMLRVSLKRHTDRLKAAVEAANGLTSFKEANMPNPTLDALAAQITQTNGVIDSAVALINSIAARIQAAVDAAIAGGASAADLAPVQDEINQLNAKTQSLADAVAANP